MRVVGWYRVGLTPEEIADEIGLSLAQVYAALAYYHANPKQIDADIADEEEEYDRLITGRAGVDEKQQERKLPERGVREKPKGYRKGSVDSRSQIKNANTAKPVDRQAESRRFAVDKAGKKSLKGSAKGAGDRHRKRS
jgi:hypothetical protein